MKLLKRSLTGNFDYYQSDIGLVLVRCDYNANQPRDSRGRWTSGGGGGGGGASAPRRATGGGGGFTTAELNKKKVSELEAIAKEVGAATPTKYKNRKSSWIAEIQKVKGGGGDDVTPPIVKPPPKLGRFTAEELGKKKLTDLEAIAREVGAEIPAKYKNRKSSWIAEIEKAQGKRGGDTPPTPPPKPSAPKFYKATRFTATELKKSGESYAKQFLDEKLIKIPPSAKETELLARKKAIGAELIQAREGGNWNKADRLMKKFRETEKEYMKLYNERQAEERKRGGFTQLEKAIREQSAISRQEAERLANSVTLDSSLSPAQAKSAREALADFYELTGGRGSTSLTTLKYDDPRAYANRAGVVNIGDGSRATLYHEFGHHAEYVSPQLLESAIAWRNGKATSKTPEKLSKLTGLNYDDDEVAMKDKFVDPYVGKVYDGYFGERATEVVSMGLERFNSPQAMKEFRDKDPDHFNFILGVLINRES